MSDGVVAATAELGRHLYVGRDDYEVYAAELIDRLAVQPAVQFAEDALNLSVEMADNLSGRLAAALGDEPAGEG